MPEVIRVMNMSDVYLTKEEHLKALKVIAARFERERRRTTSLTAALLATLGVVYFQGLIIGDLKKARPEEKKEETAG